MCFNWTIALLVNGNALHNDRSNWLILTRIDRNNVLNKLQVIVAGDLAENWMLRWRTLVEEVQEIVVNHVDEKLATPTIWGTRICH